MPGESAVAQIWIASLAAYFVVVAVVAVLLTVILLTSRHIHGGVAAIWTTGQKVANNTIHIPLLARTNHLVSTVLASAVRTAEAVGGVASHARDCPGCPGCVVGKRG